MPTVVGAQSWRQQALPLQFAQASPALAEQFERDWHVLKPAGQERFYCITHWRIGRTRDGDTAFVADSARLAPLAGVRGVVASDDPTADCAAGEAIAHFHFLGDCSPSRADIHDIVSRGTFGLIICGPRSSVGYVPDVYRLAILARSKAH